MPTHLWEVEHDYYGPEGCYYASGVVNEQNVTRFDSWQDFIENGDELADDHDPGGMNLLYRWDWHAWHLVEWFDPEGDGVDENGENGEKWELELFWMLPRKGIMLRTEIRATPADEPDVRRWLALRWEYMRSIWEPVSAWEEADA